MSNEENKLVIQSLQNELLNARSSSEVAACFRNRCAEDVSFYGSEPISKMSSVEEYAEKFWMPLSQSIPELERELLIFMGGLSDGKADGSLDGEQWVGSLCHLKGTFTRDFLSIPASQSDVQVRCGEFYHFRNGKIAEVYFLVDLIDLMHQAGVSVLPAPKGSDMVWLPPAGDTGVMLKEQNADETEASRRLIREFLYEGLNNYDQSDLTSMGVGQFFDSGVTWYGPGGIGTCRSLKEFEDFHQKPWLHAYPDRQIQDLDSLFSEGEYVASSGWRGVISNHAGEYLGVAATGNAIEFNGIDFWRRSGDQYIENWVFVDLISVFRQFGVDLFAQIQR